MNNGDSVDGSRSLIRRCLDGSWAGQVRAGESGSWGPRRRSPAATQVGCFGGPQSRKWEYGAESVVFGSGL
jgi:hypothetical protein